MLFMAEYKGANDVVSIDDILDVCGKYITNKDSLTLIKQAYDFIMDKQSLKGAFYKVENDYLGNLPISWFSYSCSNGYYTANMEPVTLKETLEKYLESAKDIPSADRERMQKLADSIHENDNNYILYAKLK